MTPPNKNRSIFNLFYEDGTRSGVFAFRELNGQYRPLTFPEGGLLWF